MHASEGIKFMHISMKQMASSSNEKQNLKKMVQIHTQRIKMYLHYLTIEPQVMNNIDLAPILESHFTTLKLCDCLYIPIE